MALPNSPIYVEDWKETLQESLDEPTVWSDVCFVEYTNKQVIHNPYQSDSSVTDYTRDNQYTYNDWSLTDDKTTIDSSGVSPEFIDRADLAQIGYDMQMERAERQGVAIQEKLENVFLGDHASMTAFDASEIGGTGDIDLTQTNIDDVIRAFKRKIRQAPGGKMARRKGMFIVWEAEDFEKLEAFAQNNGVDTQDEALRGGVSGEGFKYMGVTHYSSNLVASSGGTRHNIGGVKNIYHLGILNATFGDVEIVNEPDRRSGISVVSRVDYKGKVWNNMKPLLFDIQVNAS